MPESLSIVIVYLLLLLLLLWAVCEARTGDNLEVSFEMLV
jgi:hypothetical protein